MAKNRVLLGWLCVMAMFAIQMVVYSRRQPNTSAGNGRGDDGITYGSVAEQILNRQPIRGASPFVYRIGASWIAAQYAQVFGISIDRSFRQMNAIMMAFTLTLIYGLAIHFSSPVFATLATILYTLPWWSYSRLVWFCPVFNDLPWLLLMLISLCLIMWWPMGNLSPWRIIIFALICFLSSLTRETGVLPPIIWLCSRSWFRRHISIEVLMGDLPADSHLGTDIVRREVMLSVMFLCLSLAGIAVTRWIAFDTAGYKINGVRDYTFTAAAIDSIQRNSIWHFGLSFCLAYGGPLLALFIVYHRYWRSKIIHTPALVFYWAGIVLLAFLGGWNTLRFLSWASPVVLMFIAHLSQKFWYEPSAAVGRIIRRGLLVINAVYYVIMIHPFSGYCRDYSAWLDWGGLQSSHIESIRYLVPCSVLLVGTVIIGRKLVPDGKGNARLKKVPYPEPATRLALG